MISDCKDSLIKALKPLKDLVIVNITSGVPGYCSNQYRIFFHISGVTKMSREKADLNWSELHSDMSKLILT